MGKSGSEGYNASQFMYGFIFLMYAITAAVLFYVMANRSVTKHWHCIVKCWEFFNLEVF